jgi:capsular polysaccharide biosynthesis protein
MSDAKAPFTAIKNLSWFPGFQSSLTLYSRSAPAGFRKGFEKRIERLAVIDGFPETLLEVKGAYFIPGGVGLYDHRGNRIDASCVRRKTDTWVFVNAGPETIPLPDDCPTIRDPMLYLASFDAHWGHFLTDGISRLWSRCVFPEVRNLPCFSSSAVPNVKQVQEYLQALGIVGQLTHFTHSVRFETCFIPAASFSDRGEAYSIHLRPSQDAVALSACSRDLVQSAQPVYLSRSRFGSGRKIRREAELEQALAALGVVIVHPERLSLQEQIILFGSHHVFIGCWGSAFHGLCFCSAPERITTHILCETIPNPNFLMFDALLGCAPNYIEAMFQTPGAAQVWPNFDLTIDVEGFLAYLHGAGCV